MKKEKNLKLNAVMNAVLTMSSFLFSLITYPYAARVLGPSGTGRVLFVHSLTTYFNMFAQLGIPVYGVRACAAVRDNKEELSRTAQELLLLNLVMSLFSFLCLGAGILTIPKLREEKTLIILMSSCLVLSMIGMEWLFMAVEDYTFMAVRSLAVKLLALLLMFLMIRSDAHVLRYGLILTAGLYGHFILNFLSVRKVIRIRPQKGLSIRRHLRPVMTFFLMSFAVTIYTNLDTLMLGFMKGDTETGYYGTAAKIKTALSAAVTSLGAVLLPRASYYVEQKRFEEFRLMSKKALSVVFLLAPACALYFFLYAKQGIILIAGSEFLPGTLSLRILMPTLLLIGLTNILGMQILVPLHREKAVFLSEILGAATDLVLNLLLIPRYGPAGAAVGTLAAEFVVLFIQAFALRNWLRQLFSGIPYLRILLALLLSGAFAFGFRYLSWRNIAVLLASAAVFFSVYLLLLYLMRVGVLRELVSGIRQRFLRKNRPEGENKSA